MSKKHFCALWNTGSTIKRNGKLGLYSHRFHRSSFCSVASDAEKAGRIAAELAQKLADDRSTTTEQCSSLETRLSHAGISADGHNRPMAPPLHVSSTYSRPPEGPYHDLDSIYTRMDNPTRQALEAAVADLEGYKNSKSFAFSSGMAAASSVVMAAAQAHQKLHVILLPHDLYHGVPAVLESVFSQVNIQMHCIDMNKEITMPMLLQKLQDQLDTIPESDGILIWLETPSNPLLRVLDIADICQLCRNDRHTHTTTVVDSTLAPLQQPLTFGADVALHSATKYMGGHSDVLLGVATARQDSVICDRLESVQVAMGAVASPWDSWLTMRGLRTLFLRWERSSQTALQLASWLETQSIQVNYPGLEAHPQYNLAEKQLKGLYGGTLSIEFDDQVAATAWVASLRVAQRATSLGGTETLVEHRHSIEPPHRRTSPPGLVRISVGLEAYEDLRSDFEAAFHITKKTMQGWYA